MQVPRGQGVEGEKIKDRFQGAKVPRFQGLKDKRQVPRCQGFKGEKIKDKGQGAKGKDRERRMLKSFKELKVWEKSYQLCLEIYKATSIFPADEKFGLTSQMRRAAISTPSNIAEGYGRRTIPDYVRSLYIAYGSNCELETQTLLSQDLEYLNENKKVLLLEKINEVERMLMALIKSLENKL